MKSRNSKSSARSFRPSLLIRGLGRLWPFVKAFRFLLLIALLHSLATATCGFVLFAESWDRALGEDKIAISEATFTFCHHAICLLLFPAGYLIFLDQSLAIGVCTLNSLLIAFSPVWIPRVWAFSRQKIPTWSKSSER